LPAWSSGAIDLWYGVRLLHVDPGKAVRGYLESVEGVARVHDLHIWGMSTTENALTARLVFPHGFPGDARIREICAALRERHGIAHPTIQVETVDSGNCCVLGADEVT